MVTSTTRDYLEVVVVNMGNLHFHTDTVPQTLRVAVYMCWLRVSCVRD